MKKILALFLFLVALASLAGASPVLCGILMKGDSSTTLFNTTCTVNPDPGFFISSLTLTATDDYTGDLFGSPDVSFSATLIQSAAVFTGAIFCDVTTGLFGSDPCSSPILPSSTVSSLNLSTFTVGLINGSNSVTSGQVIGASIVLALDFGETQIPAPDVPEPTTLGLMGGALLGLGFLLARKKK
jgi:PEP-CTERM motif